MTALGPWFGGRRAYDPFLSDVWDPFDLIGNWVSVAPSTRRPSDRDDPAALAQVNVDWQETDNAHIFRADIPGEKKEEVKVQVEDGNILSISGERKKEVEEKGDTWHRVERRVGRFVRRFKLPENANLDEIKCNLENGVLTVVVPKKNPTPQQPNVKSIDVA